LGQGLEGRARRWYHGAMAIGASGSVMANRYNWLDLDPTYHNAFGQPLMRMTFDYKDNEQKLGQHAAKVVNDLAKLMSPTHLTEATRALVLVGCTLSEHAQYWRRDHGRQSTRECGEPLSAELGLLQPVRNGGLRISAQLVLQPKPSRTRSTCT
jgi:hypothetical protein